MQVIHDSTTEPEEATAPLKRSLDAAYDAMYAASLGGKLLWLNKRAEELFGLDSARLEEESCWLSIAPDDLESAQASFDLAARGEAQLFEARLLSKDGSTRSVLVTNSPIFDEGKIAAVLGILRDVTEERLATERMMRDDKLRALGRLAWGVAHNFNNSLTAVIGYTQLVLNKISDPAIRRHLGTIEKAALDAAKMVERIQNFARRENDCAMARVDLNQTIRDALELTRSRWRDDARAAGIVYDVVFRPANAVVALCDQSAMREVFVNLIINSLDAMPAGGRLTITSAVDGDILLITFADTGSGMTSETRERLFEPFYTTRGAKGRGMGLAVTYGIIERHGGEIQVTSEPDQGAAFAIKLRRAPEPEPEAPFAESAPKPSSVLVVDDEAPVRMLLSEVLRARGHEVLAAEDGLAGLRAVENTRFDIVITDLSMPGADGWTLAGELRRRWPDTKLVILTGYGGFAELAVPGGDTSVVDALISKPFNVAEIEHTINQLLTKDDY